MVKGLETFKEYFRDYADKFIVIGGTACDLAMNGAGLEFRATKDIDMVLCIEALDREFTEAFWDFVRKGQYRVKESSEGKKQYYRFKDPEEADFPFMIELFSRLPDVLNPIEGDHLTSIPTDEDISSLSAILLDDDYYRFIHEGKKLVDGITTIGPEHLIPLKARAWLDYTKRRDKGEDVDAKIIKKHKNDVFRLYQILDPDFNGLVPDSIKADLANFLLAMEKEEINLKVLGLDKATPEIVLLEIRRIYRLN